MPDDQKLHLVSGNIDFFFKSTSGHVVNIELFECTYKKGAPQLSPIDMINESIASQVTSYNNLDSSGLPVSVTYNFERLGTKLSDLPDIWKYLNIKVHRFKIQPGDYASKSFKCFGRKIYDMTLNQKNNALNEVGQGSKEFFFRTINDITVSGNVGNAKVNAFNSNNIGGIAMRYTKTYKILQPGIQALGGEKKLVYGS